MTIPYASGAVGDVTVPVFTSKGDENGGGIVTHLAVNDEGSSLRGVLAALAEPRYKGDSA